MTSPRFWLGVDTGGTFTDFVLLGEGIERIHKVLSTPSAPEEAIFQGIREMGLEEALGSGRLAIIHGTTVATNAALEGKGARTLFITNEGLEDVLLIGRQTRAELYNLTPTRDDAVIQADDILGIAGRLNADGQEIVPLDEAAIEQLVARVRAVRPEAIAISLLFSYLNPEHEQRLHAALADCAGFVCHSAEVLPIAGEYERGLATWLNAWLGPKVADYLDRLGRGASPAPVSIMQSGGGTLALDAAAGRAVNLLLSGPAGGLNAARAIGEALDEPRLMTFDMGGTSTDVALLDHGFRLTLEGHIGRWPVAVPMVDMHTIGAGGGSLAAVDAAGMLHVGPTSAGADPGPACYGRGGTGVTVTDANLVLGHLPDDLQLGGGLPLSRAASEHALAALAKQLGTSPEHAARGVIDLANEHMAQALRVISIQKGFDPADFMLLCFGGAGGLHVCALAEMLGIPRALVPRNSGVLSAQGLVRAPRQRELIQALPTETDTESLNALASTLIMQAHEAMQTEEGGALDPAALEQQVMLDVCYAGQSFPLSVPWQGDIAAAEAHFHQLHEQRYGHRLQAPVARVNLRARLSLRETLPDAPAGRVTAPGPVRTSQVAGLGPVPVRGRDSLPVDEPLNGPLIVTEAVATTFVSPGWQLLRLVSDHLLVTRIQ
ncbi:N-methylhydantoinase A [Isoalcanivorax pacificus W11-5]|uniref:N-methylhydantoinase A n=1 Tax=Isoalcanivorax pacificus W11-5 TaxID=391936 RepID=A0A0B4XHJ7_9GAMM|nr:hydantoinase/oxoprolinase family protein [Isoalcanivorax pacificus]AJD46526.1 N-methylhydantoinase A [Isoalcanivorax pacificus W11-5]